MAFGFCVLVGVAAPASASPVTWNLLNVTLSDGGAATGSFVFDADLNSYISFNIVTNSATYGDARPASPGNSGVLIVIEDISAADYTGQLQLALQFANPLTNAGGVVDIVPRPPGFSFEGRCATAICSATAPLRNVVAGQVTTGEVPEPGTLTLLAAGLAGLGLAWRRMTG